MRYVLVSFLFLTSLSSYSQSAGMITYEEKMDLHKTLPPDRQDMKDMIPQYNTAPFELLFSGDESLYRAKKIEEITSRIYWSFRFIIIQNHIGYCNGRLESI